MLYNNIEIHNVEELIPCPEGGVRWLRVPENVYNAMEASGGRAQCEGCTGVELRFVMNSPTATLKIQSLSSTRVNASHQNFYGGLQGGWECHEHDAHVGTEPCEIEIKRPTNYELLDKMNAQAGLDWDPRVMRVIFNFGEYRIIGVEGDVRPPKKSETPQKTLLTYGSSITHGSNSLAAPNNWTALVAHHLNTDLRNLGFAGSCCMEPEMIEYIASEGEKGNWNIATLELGINVLRWEESKIYERVTNTIQQIAGRNPDKPVFVISPFYCNDDFSGGDKAENWRRIIPEICAKLAYKNVVYISGTDLLGDMSLISADAVHPNIYGVQQIADRLTAIIKKHLNEVQL